MDHADAPMKLQYDKRRDAAYFAFSSADSVRQVKLGNARIVDYGADGTVVGVEFISPSRGMDLTDVPHAAEIEKAARKVGLPIRQPGIARAG